MDVYHGGPGFYYVVSYKAEEATTFTTTQVKDSNKTEFDIPTPGLYKKYSFYVQSGNDLGLAPIPITVSAYSGREG